MHRMLWLVIMVLTGLLIGGVVVVLAHAGGMAMPMAVLAGGGAFVGTVRLFLRLLRYVDERPA
jgi:hypothetical protein